MMTYARNIQNFIRTQLFTQCTVFQFPLITEFTFFFRNHFQDLFFLAYKAAPFFFLFHKKLNTNYLHYVTQNIYTNRHQLTIILRITVNVPGDTG